MIYYVGNNLFSHEGIEDSTIDEALAYCKSRKLLGVDIETTRKYARGVYPEKVYKPGLDPIVSKICMLQVGDLEHQYIIDARVTDISGFKDVFEDRNILKVFHNAKFEGKFFLTHLDSRIFNVWDTMITEQVLYNGLPIGFSLEALMYRYLDIKPIQQLTLFDSIEVSPAQVQKKAELYFLAGIDRSTEEIEEELTQEAYEKEFIDKSTRLGFINIGDRPFTLKEIKYGAQDIVAPIKIYHEQKKGRGEYQPDPRMENAFTQVLADVETKGMFFSSSKWLNVYEENKKIYTRRLDQLNNYVKDNWLDFCGTMNLFSGKPECAIKWTSNKDVMKFFKHLDICPQHTSKATGRVSYTVGAKTVFGTLPNDYKDAFFKNESPEEIKDFQDLKLAYLLFRKSEQAITTFGKDWLKYVHPVTRKIHSSFRQMMHTTRLSSTNPNIQNIPASKEYRSCFISEDPYSTLCADYSSQEVRVLAQVSGVKALRDFFIKGNKTFGKDFHSFVATNMFRIMRGDPHLIIQKDTHPDERTKAKSLTFSNNYGAGAYSISKQLGVSEEEAQEFIDAYFDGLPGLRENFERVKGKAVKRGWIEIDAFTRQRYFFPHFKEMNDAYKKATSFYPDNYEGLSWEEQYKIRKNLKNNPEYSALWKKYFKLRGMLERKALNFRIQGPSAKITKLAGLYIYKWRVKNGIDFEFYIDNFIHDEIKNQILPGYPGEKVLRESMIKAGSIICKDVPMEVDCKLSKHWDH